MTETTVTQITMRRIWGQGNKMVRAGERILCEFPVKNGDGKLRINILTVEVVALPAGAIRSPRKFVPVVKNWENLEENGNIPSYQVEVVPIENIKGAHHIELHNGGGGNNF